MFTNLNKEPVAWNKEPVAWNVEPVGFRSGYGLFVSGYGLFGLVTAVRHDGLASASYRVFTVTVGEACDTSLHDARVEPKTSTPL